QDGFRLALASGRCDDEAVLRPGLGDPTLACVKDRGGLLGTHSPTLVLSQRYENSVYARLLPKFSKLSLMLTMSTSSEPPFLGPRSPRPIIWMYRFGEK